MKAIYKYEIGFDAKVVAPDGFPVHAGLDPNGMICVWILHHDTQGELSEWRYRVFGTGHPLPDPCEPVASFVDGRFVWHVLRVAP